LVAYLSDRPLSHPRQTTPRRLADRLSAPAAV